MNQNLEFKLLLLKFLKGTKEELEAKGLIATLDAAIDDIEEQISIINDAYEQDSKRTS